MFLHWLLLLGSIMNLRSRCSIVIVNFAVSKKWKLFENLRFRQKMSLDLAHETRTEAVQANLKVC